MKRTVLLLCVVVMSFVFMRAYSSNRIITSWGENLDKENVWNVYPRPIMERPDWQNLNGEWDYAITPLNSTIPHDYDGKILVPFPVESQLSGVEKRLSEKDALWYKRTFTIPSSWRQQKVLLHFGAVDWQADVWVNGIKVGTHTGGYTPFAFDITAALRKGENVLDVRVVDTTDKGYQPRGKQVSNPGGIWYTPVSGIWQTVWLEPVAPIYIKNVRTLPDIDRNILSLDVEKSEQYADIVAEVNVYANGKLVARGSSVNNAAVEVQMPADVKLWSPASPFLYDVEVIIKRGGKQLDKVDSYAAMRKFSTRRDADGIVRMQLNNKDLFQFGTLDQGWWPDGLYTAPSHEALVYDIDKTKEWGFNMIRKHVKVEPAVWYTHCDRVGMIVWQDMPSGDSCYPWQNRQYFQGSENVRSAASEANFRKEWREIMDYLYSYPSIAVWVPFNEAWGQFKTVEITQWTQNYDPSRLVNSASGGNFFACGDIVDLHNYPAPEMYLYDATRANVLGEYGGIGYVVEGHLWEPNRNWGYIQYNSSEAVTNEYVKYAEMLLDFIRRGFTAAIYTQTTDVEVEVNGIMTYDRKVVKMDEARIKEINNRICNSLNK
ncbi:MAG: beta-galactosidase [Bacteroidaceae bacterium]|nr:beta-galactosidase [Bacteroidaceae bacterium]